MSHFFTSDWHIHTEHSCDQACLPMQDLAQSSYAQGIADCGVTDHLHTPFNLPDIENSYRAYLDAKRKGFHFGIELSVITRWELDRIENGDFDPAKPPVYGLRSGGPAGGPLALGATEETLGRLHIEYVVAAAHWPMYAPIELNPLIQDYHRQQMFLSTDPRVDIIAHPWWWDNRWDRGEQWAADFDLIPHAMHDELAAAARENNKLIEINTAVMLSPQYTERFRRQYVEFLRCLYEQGVGMTIGSDCHEPVYGNYQEAAAAMLAAVGFKPADFSMPRFRSELVAMNITD